MQLCIKPKEVGGNFCINPILSRRLAIDFKYFFFLTLFRTCEVKDEAVFGYILLLKSFGIMLKMSKYSSHFKKNDLV